MKQDIVGCGLAVAVALQSLAAMAAPQYEVRAPEIAACMKPVAPICEASGLSLPRLRTRAPRIRRRPILLIRPHHVRWIRRPLWHQRRLGPRCPGAPPSSPLSHLGSSAHASALGKQGLLQYVAGDLGRGSTWPAPPSMRRWRLILTI